MTPFLPFIFLTLAFSLLYLRGHSHPLFRHAWLIAASLACLLGLYAHLLQVIAIPIILLFVVLAWAAASSKLHLRWRWLAGLLFIGMALALGLHIVPGFTPLPILQSVTLSPDALPYSLYFNLDKPLIGLLILGIWYQRPAHTLSWSATGLSLSWLLPLIITVVLSLAWLLNQIDFAPKIIDGLLLWMWANLFFTCIAEEALFRGVLQHQLAQHLQQQTAGKWIAIAIAALLFGLAHFGGGWVYVTLATVAGMGYGVLYHVTGRIEATILGHFTLNLTHIILFTYPNY